MFTIPLPAVYLFRCCDNCMMPYMFKDHRGDTLNFHYANRKYCSGCTDYYIGSSSLHVKGYRKDWPKELIELRRMQLGIKRILNIRQQLQDYHIELLKEISKTKDHESRTTAQLIIRNFVGPEKRNHRASNG